MGFFSFVRRFFSEATGPGLPPWATLDGGTLHADAPSAYADYFARLGYPPEGFTRQQLGVARRCMSKDIGKMVPPGICVNFRNASAYSPDIAPEGPFINWSKEYERISKG
jgi:hypothetical protein